MTPLEIAEPKDKPLAQEDDGLNKQRKKLETFTTSGCGYGRAKEKRLHVFWNFLWPKLENLGWTKVVGTGEFDGATFFLPKGVDMNTSKRGQYFNRIRDVIDQILKKKTVDESELAREFLSRMGIEEGVETDMPVPTQRRKRRPRSPRPSPEQSRPERLDLSWKTAGRTFPKTSSRIGDDYQVGHLPAAGSCKTAEDHEILYDQVWDPVRAQAANAQDFAHKTAPPNKKESGMVLLHENGYNVENLESELKRASPTDGSDWTAEEKELFRLEIFRLRKDIHALSKAMSKSVCSCLTYYLGTFKKSDGYRVLKTVCSEERIERQAAAEQGLDACAICGDGGNLLICDGCDGEYHMTCLRPPLASVPDGDWQCEDCISQKFLDARDYIIKNTGLFEALDGLYKRRKLENGAEESDYSSVESGTNSGSSAAVSLLGDTYADGTTFRPSPDTIEAIKKMAECISDALSLSPRTSIVPGSKLVEARAKSEGLHDIFTADVS